MRNSWKKTAAFVLAFTLVAAPLTQTAGKGGLFGGSAITASAEQQEELLTTITPTGKEQASFSTANVATVSFSYSAGGSSVYTASWGWWGYGLTATVTPVEGYTITKCVFYDDENRTATDSEAPFVVETTEEDKTPKVNGTPILAYTSKGIKKIEVYGYATPSVVELTADNVTIDDFTYDGTEKTPVLKYTDGENEVTLTKDTDYTIVETEGDNTSATNAGTYFIHINGTGSYAGENVLLMWNISKADPTVTAPTVKTGLTYTGSAQALAEAGTTTGGTLQYGVQVTPTVYKADGEAIDVNVADLNAGDVLQVTRDNSSKINFIGGTVKYRDSEGNLKSENIDYIDYGYWSSIPPYHFIDLSYSGGGHMLNNVDYNALIVTSKADDTITIEPYNYNASEMTTAWSDTVPEATDAGIYRLMYRVVGDNNYNSFGDVSGCLFGASEIAKADVSVTGAELTYNGEPQNLISGDVPAGTLFSLTAPQEPDYETEKTKISGWISALNDKANNASSSEEGDYYYSAASALSYYYSVLNYLNRNYESNPVDVMSEAVRKAGDMAQYEVTPSDDVKEAIDYINTYIKDKTLNDAKARFATVEPDDWSDTITATNAGEYTVYYKGSGNYDDTVKNVTATIERAAPAVVIPADLTAKYGQTLADVKLPTVENGIWAWNIPTTTSVGDVGKNPFSATFLPKNTKNYTLRTTDLTVNVTAIPANPTAVGTLNATYGQTLADVKLPTVEDGSGTWAWKDAATTPVGNAGEHTFKAVFTPANTNYTPVEQDVTINVAKATPTTEAPTNLSATYGATLADVTLTPGWTWDAPKTSVGNVGEQSFAATFTPADTANYNVVKQNLTVNVVAVDKAALNEAVTVADTYLATIKKTVYADPALVLSSAIADAKAVAENDNVTEEQVAQAITAVNNAVTTAKAAVKEIDDTLAAKAVTDMINALPAVDDITSADKTAVEAARAAYNALTADQKANVANAKVLDYAEKLYDSLEAQAAAETAKAEAETDAATAKAAQTKAEADAATAKAAQTKAEADAATAKAAQAKAEEDAAAAKTAQATAEKAAVDAKTAKAKAEADATTAKAAQTKAEEDAAAAKAAQATAEKNAEAAKAAQAKAEEDAATAKTAQTKAEEDAAAAKTAQATAEKNAEAAKAAQAKAEEDAAAAKTAQATAEKNAETAKAAQAKAEEDAATAKTAQATAEKNAEAAKTAQTKAEEDAATAKTAQATAEKNAEASNSKVSDLTEQLAAAVKQIEELESSGNADEALKKQVAELKEQLDAAKTAQNEANEALAKAQDVAASKIAAAEAAQEKAEEEAAAAEKAQATAEQTAKEATEKSAAAEKVQATAEQTAKEATEKAAAAEKAQATAEKAAKEATEKAAVAEEAQAVANQAAADTAIEKINAIGSVNKTNYCENKIVRARAIYDSLTDEQKALVPADIVAKLTAAETEYDTLPQTGMSGLHKLFAGLASLMGIAGVGLVKKSRKEDEEE